jgi:quercetin dioxygenase-like cupin family protein
MRISARATRWLVLVLLLVVAGLADGASARQAKATNTPLMSMRWQPYAPGSPLQVAVLWGDRTKPVQYAMYLKMPAGFVAGRHSHTNDYHAVAVQGRWIHSNEDGKPHQLTAGGVAFQPGKQVHNDECRGTTDCIILLYQMGPGDFIPAK